MLLSVVLGQYFGKARCVMAKVITVDAVAFAEKLVLSIEDKGPSICHQLLNLKGSQRNAGLSAMAAIKQNADKLSAALLGQYVATKKKAQGTGGG